MEQNSEKWTAVDLLQFFASMENLDQSAYDGANRKFFDQILDAQFALLDLIEKYGYGENGVNKDNVAFYWEKYIYKTFGSRN